MRTSATISLALGSVVAVAERSEVTFVPGVWADRLHGYHENYKLAEERDYGSHRYFAAMRLGIHPWRVATCLHVCDGRPVRLGVVLDANSFGPKRT